MFYSDLVGVNKGEYIRNGGKSFPLVAETVGRNTESTVRVVDGKLCVTDSVVGSDIFKIQGNPDEVPYTSKGFPTFTNKELADTADNPLVIVCTKGIKFYKDVPTYLNVLFVNDEFMIAMLIYGACEFQFSDGSFIPLQRCNEDDLDRKSTYPAFNCKSLKNMVYCKTNGGWDKTYEMVCPLFVRVKGDNFSIRCNQDLAYVFNPQAIENQENLEKAREEERKRKAEQKKIEEEERRKKAREESERRRIEEMKRRQEELQAKKEAEAEKRRAKRATKTKEIKGTKSNGRSVGAEAFLAFVNKHN